MAQLMFKIANEPPTPILGVNPNVPPVLVAFLDRALAKDPDERFQTGEEFAGALRAAMSGASAAVPAAAAAAVAAAAAAAPAAAAGGVDIEL
jgi:serine/threonine protein kinase